MILGEDVIAAVLKPFDGDSPVGVDGRDGADEETSDILRELKAERRAIVKQELSAHTAEDPALADVSDRWSALAETAISYLSERSKDLEAITILLEASVRTDGLAGLASALQLLRDFVEAFWDIGMYPLADEEEKDGARFVPLSGLSGGSDRDGALILPFRRMRLVGQLTHGEKLQTDAKFNNAQNAQSEESRGSLMRAAEEELELQKSGARSISAASARSAVELLDRAEQDWRRTIDFIAARTKPLLPAASNLTAELRSSREWLTSLLSEQLTAAQESASAQPEANGGGGEGSPAAPALALVPGQIAGREQALRTILAVSEFFDKTEPLSPVGPALRDVHRRARMTFDELLAEALPESGSRETFYLRMGIRPPPEAA